MYAQLKERFGRNGNPSVALHIAISSISILAVLVIWMVVSGEASGGY